MAGEMVHAEFPCTNVDRAATFWKNVLGWEFGGSAMEGYDYRMARIDDRSGVAIMPAEATGHPNVYFDTKDIDATIAKVRESGGEAADKTPVPTHGWFSACTDTEGNAFHLWQGDSSAA